jgi:hypothetical protein
VVVKGASNAQGAITNTSLQSYPEAFPRTINLGTITADGTITLAVTNLAYKAALQGNATNVFTGSWADGQGFRLILTNTTASVATNWFVSGKLAGIGTTNNFKIAANDVVTFTAVNDSANGWLYFADDALVDVTEGGFEDGNYGLFTKSGSTATINSSQVTTASIIDANVTTAKLADGAVTGAKIAADTITPHNLAGTFAFTNVTEFGDSAATVWSHELADGEFLTATLKLGQIVGPTNWSSHVYTWNAYRLGTNTVIVDDYELRRLPTNSAAYFVADVLSNEVLLTAAGHVGETNKITGIVEWIKGGFGAATVVDETEFPVIESSLAGGQNSLSTSRTVDMPSGVVEGDLLLMIVAMSTGTEATSAGWTTVPSGSLRQALLWRLAPASPPASVTLTTASNSRTAWVVYRISGHDAAASPAVQYVSTLAPPEVTPSWGNAKTLWFASVASRRSDWVPTDPPTSYTGLVDIAPSYGNTTTAYVRLGVAHRFLDASSEQPGTFTITGTTDSPAAMTIAIKPAP